MDCKNVCNLLVKYVAGELNTWDKASVEEHIGQCEACRKELSQLRHILEVSRKQHMPEPQDSYWDNYSQRVFQKIESHKQEIPKINLDALKFRLSPGSLQWVVPACAATVLLVILSISMVNVKDKIPVVVAMAPQPAKEAQTAQPLPQPVQQKAITRTVAVKRPASAITKVRKEADKLEEVLNQQDMEKSYDVLVDGLTHKEMQKLLSKINEEIKKSL